MRYIQHESHLHQKGLKLNITEQYEIYKHYKQSQISVINRQPYYKPHMLFETITDSCHSRTSASSTPITGKMIIITVNSAGTVKH